LPSLADQLKSLDREQLISVCEILEEAKERKKRRQFFELYPETGPLRRELYPKHMEFFNAGAKYRERGAMCANRVGKTLGMGGYETTCHLTGLYPDWWTGRRFDHPVEWWAAGKTNETTRDIIQKTMLGAVLGKTGRKSVDGRGLIPGDLLGKPTWKAGVPDLLDTIKVKHVTGEWSRLGLKSYQQGRGSFEGTEKHGIWCDEEVPLDIYSECLIRTATTDGIILVTWTALEGLSPMVLEYMPQEMRLD